MKRIKLKIEGKVQGVFFRETTKKVADELGIKGYVKNLDDGSVEIVAEGRENDLLTFIDFCKIGPKLARVKKAKIIWDEFKNEFNKFDIRY